MTLSSALAALFGRRLSLQERATLQESLKIDTGEGLRRFTLFVAKFALAFELTGAAILTLWWLRLYGFGQSAYYGLFHAVSAFNNAGFSLFSDNLAGFRGHRGGNLVVSPLIIAGGLGFFTMREIAGFTDRSNDRLTLHTKFVLVVTGALLAYGTGAILVLEWATPKTLGNLPVWEKVLASWFPFQVSNEIRGSCKPGNNSKTSRESPSIFGVWMFSGFSKSSSSENLGLRYRAT